MFIKKNMLSKMDEFVEMAQKNNEDIICYLDEDNNDDDIKKILFQTGKKGFRYIIAKAMETHIEGFENKEKVIFMVNEKENLEYVTEKITEWKEDFIPFIAKEEIEKMIERKIVLMVEGKNEYTEIRTGLTVAKNNIDYLKEQEKIEATRSFKKIRGVSFEKYRPTKTEEIIKQGFSREATYYF